MSRREKKSAKTEDTLEVRSPQLSFLWEENPSRKIWCVLNSNNKLPNKYLSQYLTNVLGKQTHFFTVNLSSGILFHFILGNIVSVCFRVFLSHAKRLFNILLPRQIFMSFFCIFPLGKFSLCVFFHLPLKKNAEMTHSPPTRKRFCLLCSDVINWHCDTCVIIVK